LSFAELRIRDDVGRNREEIVGLELPKERTLRLWVQNLGRKAVQAPLVGRTFELTAGTGKHALRLDLDR